MEMGIWGKKIVCGWAMLALLALSASCSVKSQAEYTRKDKGERFALVAGDKASTATRPVADAPASSAQKVTAQAPEAAPQAPKATVASASRTETDAQASKPEAAKPEAKVEVPTQQLDVAAASIENQTKDATEKIYSLRFRASKIEYSKQSQLEIKEIAAVLQAHPELKAVVEGYTDSRGDAEMNLYLSQQRALRLKSTLLRKGSIESRRIETRGHGEDAPIADNSTPEGREKNRRVTIRFERVDTSGVTVAPVVSDAPAILVAEPLKLSEKKAEEKKSEDPKPEIQAPASPSKSGAHSAQAEKKDIPLAENVSYAPLSEDGNWPPKRYYIDISVSKCTLMLYELQSDGSKRLVKPYKVATAKKGTPFPEGMGMVTGIETNPWWFPTENMKRRAAMRGQDLAPVPPGKKSNPMGAVKIHLSHENDGGSYRIHGTNAPGQIGRRVSMGCVRMHNNDGLELAKLISVGTEVNISQ